MEIKYARVVPLYKDGDKKCMVNYRPISVLPVASKILERAVQIQLFQHLDKSSQLSPFQCGFRKNHSTQDAITYFTDCIRKGIDEGCVTAPEFVDFQKVFDNVNHQLLLEKLPGYGRTMNWGGSRTILRVDVNLLSMATHSLHLSR